jgi:hypothetical protein
MTLSTSRGLPQTSSCSQAGLAPMHLCVTPLIELTSACDGLSGSTRTTDPQPRAATRNWNRRSHQPGSHIVELPKWATHTHRRTAMPASAFTPRETFAFQPMPMPLLCVQNRTRSALYVFLLQSLTLLGPVDPRASTHQEIPDARSGYT